MTSPIESQVPQGSPVQHVAFIMDGNRRWAKAQGLSSSEGHKEGAKTAEKVIEWCVRAGIPHVTLWALSTENWKKRSATELSTILQLLSQYQEKRAYLHEHGVSTRILGNKETMSLQLRTLSDLVDKNLYLPNPRLQVHLAINYGGRDELLCAFKELHTAGIHEPTPEEVSKCLYTRNVPDVDLIIRTGGEQRLSGFMLWQSEYAELSFLDTLWPDMTQEKFAEVLNNYTQRKRNFGA